MKSLKNNLLILFFISSNLVLGQTPRKCAVGEQSSELLKKRHENLNLELTKYYSKYGRKSLNSDEIIRIPVVVHIIHNNAQGVIGGPNNSNISDEQIFSQIRVLNEDYRKKIGTPGFNNSPFGTDMGIEFFLAQKDPNNKPTIGINRIYSPKSSFDIFKDNLLMSNLSYWDSNKYLNIWVTNLADNYIGYGEFPGGAFDGLELTDVDERIDGVIIDNSVFGYKTGTASTGVYNAGRTLTHEIGHWFGLLHTWGDEFCGSDYVDDTPPTEKGNLSIFCKTTFSNCKGVKTLNMIENYLDYTPDSCMNIFTSGQKTRVRAILEISKRRKRLVENSKFNLPSTEALVVNLIENPSQKSYFEFQILVNNFKNFDYLIFDLLGNKLREGKFLDSPSRIVQVDKKGLSKGVYLLKVYTSEETIIKKLINL